MKIAGRLNYFFSFELVLIVLFILLTTNFAYTQRPDKVFYDPDNIMNPGVHGPFHFQKSGYNPDNSILQNASEPLVIPTHDSSGQATHPCVIDFLQEHNMQNWCGYRYWMVMTPYPHFNALKEDPNILASNDGTTWVVPAGVVNPVVGKPDSCNNADVDMIYNPDLNELWIYYGFHHFSRIYDYGCLKLIRINHRMEITEPISITKNRPIYSDKNAFMFNDSVPLSPCVWRESSDRWHMWVIYLSDQKMAYSFSSDGIHWNDFKTCTDKNGKYPFSNLGPYCRVWHIECKPNYNEHRVEFFTNGKIFDLITNPSSTQYLYYAETPMDQLTVINTPLHNPILSTSYGYDWDNAVIYRSAFVIYNTDSGYYYKVWYPAVNNKKVWGIGFTQGMLNTPISKCKYVTIATNDTLDVTAYEEITDTFSIYSNTDWNISSNQKWLSVSDTSGTKNETIFLTIMPNPSLVKRYATVTISSYNLAPKTIIVVQEGLTTKVGSAINDRIFFYPNPVTGKLNIEFAENAYPYYISVYSVNGNLEYTSAIKDNFVAIDMSKFKTGYYFIRIIANDNVFTKKVCKQ